MKMEEIPMNWITNDPQAAKSLKKADKAFEAARIAAQDAKQEAYRRVSA